MTFQYRQEFFFAYRLHKNYVCRQRSTKNSCHKRGILSGAYEYGIEELLIKYYAYYIYEHLSIDFYEKLIKEKGKAATSNFYMQLKKFLVEKVKNIARKRDLSKIDWTSKEGDELVKNIFEDTLKAFENYEG